MQTVSDEQLVQWVAAGDSSCLGTLFERHHIGLYNFLLQMTGNPALSEDLVQEAFMRVLKAAKGFRAEASFRSWLFNIARNALYDYLRKHKRIEPLHDDGTDLVTEEAGPADQFAGDERDEKFVAAFSGLSEADREVIWLGRFVLDSFDELGRALDCSAATARVRMHRAVTRLKNLLQHTDEISAHA